MSSNEGASAPQQRSRIVSNGAAAAAVMLSLAGLPGAAAFAPGGSVGAVATTGASRSGSVLAMRASRPGRSVGPSMIYTPPRKDTEARSLEEIKEALDRAVRIPSPRSRESPKTSVQRSPCTSLYGNWRPTTGTENWKSASGRTALKKPAKAVAEAAEGSEAKPALRGRPRAPKKSAVKPEILPEFIARAAQVLLINKGSMDSNLFGQAWKTIHPKAPLSSFKSHKGVAVHQMMRENSDFFSVGETNRHKVKMFGVFEDKVEAYMSECGATGGVLTIRDDGELVKLREGITDGLTEETVEDVDNEEASVADGTVAASALSEEAVSEELVEEEESAAAPVHDARLAIMDVPMQGKARNSRGYDRRAVQQRVRQVENVVEQEIDDTSAAPRALDDDAAVSPTISLYNGWAVDGRDVIMEVSNEGPVTATLKEVVEGLVAENEAIKAVDLGSGNGWLSRLTKTMAPEAEVTGVDAASLMVKRAEELDNEGVCNYACADVEQWEPEGGEGSLDLVLAVELLHLVEDPKALLERAVAWLKPGGRMIVTLECYKENRLSRTWSNDLGIPMTVLAQKKWVDMVEAAGIKEVTATRSQPKGPWPGMLVLEGAKV